MGATIPEILARAAEQFGANEALVDGDVRLTFAQLHDEVNEAARSFIAHGIELGDRVAIWAPNIHEWVVAGLGALSAGAAIVPLNTRFKGNEAADVLQRSGAKILLTVNGFLGIDYPALIGQHATVERVITLRGDGDTWAEFLRVKATIEKLQQRHSEITESVISDIIFTSGTTGSPKGVVATHGQTVRAFTEWSRGIGLCDTDRYLIVNPFFHTFGYKAGIVACILRGSTIIPQSVFDVPEILTKVSAERITILPGPPTLYLSILNHADRNRHDLSSLRLAVTGAAAVPVSMILRMRNELTFEVIVTGYGLTESTGVVSMCHPDDDPEIIANTSGRAIDGVEIQIWAEDGAPLPPGQPGEIMVRGYNVTSGYYNDPETTRDTITTNGWLHTGDIGTLNEQGYLTITDRKKDMYIMGGFNVSPAEVENVMMQHDAIGQVAVVGMPDDRMGEVGCAFVVLRAAVQESDLIDWARDRMANYKVPRRFIDVPSLPTNASGKVLKIELRKQLTQGDV